MWPRVVLVALCGQLRIQACGPPPPEDQSSGVTSGFNRRHQKTYPVNMDARETVLSTEQQDLLNKKKVCDLCLRNLNKNRVYMN